MPHAPPLSEKRGEPMRIFVPKNVRWGAKLGSVAGLCYAVVALVAFGLQDLESDAINLWFLLVAYPIVGVIGGVFVGLLRPLLSSRVRAAVIGAVLGPILANLLMPVAYGPWWVWSTDQWIGNVIGGICLGAGLGAIWWDDPAVG